MFDEIGRYIIDDYDALPTFSSFLPGVAGIYGKPLWSFYVNRGQGIASFGVKSKDYPIMEYHSANNAYQDTPLLGFRTFYQGHRVGKTFGKSEESFLVEPFDTARTRFASSMKSGDDLPTRSMYIGSNEMQIREVDRVNQIETNVTYFILPEEDFGAFVHSTTITNLDDRPLRLSVLDGLARIQPAGGKLNLLLKTRKEEARKDRRLVAKQQREEEEERRLLQRKKRQFSESAHDVATRGSVKPSSRALAGKALEDQTPSKVVPLLPHSVPGGIRPLAVPTVEAMSAIELPLSCGRRRPCSRRRRRFELRTR